MSEPYKLDTTLHDRIYTNEIAAYYLPKSRPQDSPCAIITGGQPGSGKSGLAALAIERFNDSGYILVDDDKLRPYHPHYEILMKTNSKMAANLTHPDAGRWAERLLRDGVAAHRNIIIDQTSRDPAAMTNMTQGLKQVGYRVELYVMASPEYVSEQRIYQRYEEQRERYGYGRFSTKEKHNEAYIGIAKTVSSVEVGKQVDRLCIYDRYIHVIYDNILENGQWQKEPLALKKLEQERTRPMTLKEHQEYLRGYKKLADLLAKPERKASEQEIQNIQDLHSQAKLYLAAGISRQSSKNFNAQYLIPSHKAVALDTERLSDMVSNASGVRACREEVEHLSRLVYGRSNVFGNELSAIGKGLGDWERVKKQVENDPTSISPLSGNERLFGKDQARKEAEANIPRLGQAIENYADASRQARQEIIERHNAEQIRLGQSIELPDRDIHNILNLPKEKQLEALAKSPDLQKQLDSYMQKIDNRLERFKFT